MVTGEHAPATAARGRVLVVDDDPALAEMLTIVLRNEGFESRVCSAGDRALAAFRDFRPDVVLLDLMLPGQGRHRRLQGDPRASPASRSSCSPPRATRSTWSSGSSPGADDYVVKPFKPKELVARIRARVRKYDAAPPGDPHDRRPGHRRRRPPGHPRRPGHLAHAAGVRPAGVPGAQAVAGVHPRGPARAGVGLPARRRHAAGQRARAAAAVEDRARPGEPRDRGDRPGRRLQGRADVARRARSARAATVSGAGPSRPAWCSARCCCPRSSSASSGGRCMRQITDGLVQRPGRRGGGRGGPLEQRRGAAQPERRDRPTSTLGAQLPDLVSARDVARADPGLRRGPHRPAPADPGAGTLGGGERFTPGLDLEQRAGAAPRRRSSSRRRPARRGRSPSIALRRRRPERGDVPGVAVGTRLVLPGRRRHLRALPPLPDDRPSSAPSPWSGRALLTSGALLLVLVAGALLAGHPAGRHAGAAGAADRPSGWPPGRLEERMQVRGEDDIARLAHVVQPDGDAACRSRSASSRTCRPRSAASSPTCPTSCAPRSPRCGWPATSCTTPGERFDPVTARSAELLQNELDRFELLLTDLLEISRFDAGAAALAPRGRRPGRRRPPGGRRRSRCSPSDAAPGVRRPRAGAARASSRPTSAGSSGSSATSSPTPSTTPTPPTCVILRRTRRRGRRARRARLRRRAAARRRGPGVQPVLAGRPGPGPHVRRHRAGALDLARGRPAPRRLAAGLGHARRAARSSGSRCPAARARGSRGARCRWCRATRSSPAARARTAREASRRPLAAVVVLRSCALAGCASLPTDGPVEDGRRRDPDDLGGALRLQPARARGPAPTPDEIVAGFLDALQATPVSTTGGRRSSSPQAAVATWRPERSTIVYGGQYHRDRGPVVDVRTCRDAFELDRRGRWLGPLGRRRRGPAAGFRLARDDGEWRIAGPARRDGRPAVALRVPLPRSTPCYFFDPTGSVLVPEPVYLPRGVQAPDPAGRRAARRARRRGARAGRALLLPGRHPARRRRPGRAERRGAGAAERRRSSTSTRTTSTSRPRSSRGRCGQLRDVDSLPDHRGRQRRSSCRTAVGGRRRRASSSLDPAGRRRVAGPVRAPRPRRGAGRRGARRSSPPPCRRRRPTPSRRPGPLGVDLASQRFALVGRRQERRRRRAAPRTATPTRRTPAPTCCARCGTAPATSGWSTARRRGSRLVVVVRRAESRVLHRPDAARAGRSGPPRCRATAAGSSSPSGRRPGSGCRSTAWSATARDVRCG